jgi:hypothetical protein
MSPGAGRDQGRRRPGQARAGFVRRRWPDGGIVPGTRPAGPPDRLGGQFIQDRVVDRDRPESRPDETVRGARDLDRPRHRVGPGLIRPDPVRPEPVRGIPDAGERRDFVPSGTFRELI